MEHKRMSAGESACRQHLDAMNDGQDCFCHDVVIYYQEIEQVQPQHTIGRELLKLALDKEYQIDFTEEMIYYVHNGKPMLRNFKEKNPIHFNISHCKGMVVCALSDCPIGIDVESSRNITDRMIREVCNEQERQYIATSNHTDAFLELWTLKESYLKMTGEGMRIPVSQVNFNFSGSEIKSNREGYYYQTKLANQYILAVCSKERCNEPRITKNL